MSAIDEFLQVSGLLRAVNDTFEKQHQQITAGAPEADKLFMEYFYQNRDTIIREAAEAIARAFTEDELRQLTHFYQTPLGKMLLSKMPFASSQVTEIIAKWQLKALEDIEVRLFEDKIAKY